MTQVPSEKAAGPATSAAARIGGVVASPWRAFNALIDDRRAHPIEPVLVYAFVVCAIAGVEVYRLLTLASEAPLIIVKRLLDVVLRAGRTDFAVIVGAAAVVGCVAWALKRRVVGAAIATAYLLVLLALAKGVGGLLAIAGLELWWLPHRAVDSFAVVVNGKVDVARFVVKCVVAWGPGVAVLLAWLRASVHAVKGAAPTPRRARIGFFVVVAVMGLLGLGSLVDVVGRSEQLRPRLRGDAFPSVSLKKLEGRGRVDVAALARSPGTRVVVVDFWASWCGPCRRSLPELSKLAARLKDKNVVVVGVNREPQEIEAARKAWAEIAPSFDSLVDDRGLGERVGLTSLPSSYVLDSKGQIRHLHLGYTDPTVVAAEVEALLLESP